MTAASAAKFIDHIYADDAFYTGLHLGHRQPRYFTSAPAGTDPARGAFTPSPSKHRGPMRPGKTRRDKGLTPRS
jgi:hypothetical protein